MDRLFQLYFLVRNNGNSDTIRQLLREMQHVVIHAHICNYLLQVAVESRLDNLIVVRELINAGADVNVAKQNGLTPLHCAVLRRKHRVVNALIESGANINAESRLQRTSLHFAISNYGIYDCSYNLSEHSSGPDIRIVETLLKQENIRINKRDNNGDTPLILAVRRRHFNTVLLLLEKGANPHIRNRDWETLLHIALYDEKPSLAILVQLLTHRARLYCADRKRKTPIDILFQNIGNTQNLLDACTCLKVVALHYRIKKPLILMLKRNIQLWKYFKNCFDNVRMMRSDIIAKKKTIFDFVMRRFNQSDFDNPVIQVYKPIVDRLLAGHYLKYLNLLLLRVSKSNLFAVLEIVLFKYCEIRPKGPNNEEIIYSIDHKELFDIKNHHEITDTVGCRKMTDVKVCKELPYSKNCKNTPDAKDSKDTPDSRYSSDSPDSRYSIESSDTRDNIDKSVARYCMDKRDARDSMDTPNARDSLDTPHARVRMDTPDAKDRRNTPNVKDRKDAPDENNSPKLNFNFFLIINLLSEYLSTLDVFHLIATFSTAKISVLSKMYYN